MKITMAGLCLLALASATQAEAQQRASTTRMTCRSAAAVVARSGAVVLGTGGDTYDRFVASEILCPAGLYARPAFVPTTDNPQCYVGFYCSSAPPMFGR